MKLYHVLNRGVEKRTIFLDERDHLRFIHDLYEFNDIDTTIANKYYFHKSLKYSDTWCPNIDKALKKRRFLVKILAFCLMPNHYHLLLSPVIEKGVPLFMHKLNMGYAKYFNERYKRTGVLFQGKYKSVPIYGDPHFSHIPYYIHFNPLDLKMPEWRTKDIKNPRQALSFLKTYRWSSHLDYLGKKNFPSVTQREFLLDFFAGEKGYSRGVEQKIKDFSIDEIETAILEPNSQH